MPTHPLLLFVLAPLAALAALPVSIPNAWSPRERTAAAVVTAPLIASHVRFLADDLLEGRAPATRGSDLAMRYIATQFERLGLVPAGDAGSYLQSFDVVGLLGTITAPPVFSAPGTKEVIRLQPGVDMVVAPGRQLPTASLSDAELVFVGYGIDAPEQRWNDFKDVDLKGKILVVMNSDPEDDPSLFAGKTRLYYGRWDYKFAEAARKGAAGAIIIHTTHSAGYPWQVVQTSWSGEEFELPAVPGEPHVQFRMWVTEEAARRIVALGALGQVGSGGGSGRGGGHDLDELRRSAEKRDFRPVPLGVRLSVAMQIRVRSLKTANVLGVLPGSDPKRKSELVVVSAHHDHLGIREKKDGDDIYNGALDNASGVAALLTIAEAATRVAPPSRSILFASVAAEESGLLGSEYLCGHPIAGHGLPAAVVAADLNIDGINIWGRTRDITYTGLGKSSLDEVVTAAAAAQGRTVAPDQFPDRGHFYRSDQFNFARIGVPSVYLKSGMDFIGHDKDWGRAQIVDFETRRYHQPSDQIDATWNLDGALDDVRLMTTLVLRIAELKAMPSWKPGDEFEGSRKRALAPLAQAAPTK